jgi:hypothetical protein
LREEDFAAREGRWFFLGPKGEDEIALIVEVKAAEDRAAKRRIGIDAVVEDKSETHFFFARPEFGVKRPFRVAGDEGGEKGFESGL